MTSHIVDRINDPALGSSEPTQAEMMAGALQKLSLNRKGFILQVEAGRIDPASHTNDAWGAIMDTIEMDLALEVTLKDIKRNPLRPYFPNMDYPQKKTLKPPGLHIPVTRFGYIRLPGPVSPGQGPLTLSSANRTQGFLNFQDGESLVL